MAPERMGEYLRALRKLFLRYEYHPSVYGHFGMGCVHCRIDFDLASAPGVRRFRAFLEDASDLVVGLGGSLSGEHGDGQARAELLGKMFGPELVRAFGEFKAIWDPDGKMNPGKIVDPRRFDEDLKLGAGYAPWRPETHFKYPDDHGELAHATLRCVGIGKCRRLEGQPDDDTMCPSFMVTREEKHATRGRAHLLWEMLQRGPNERGWRDEAVKESLDLCLACKGCKGDCPVNVDIATYKAEFLAHYYDGRLRPRSAYAFGLIDRWARLASHAPGLANLATQLPVLRDVSRWMAGASPERHLPAFAPRTFQSWFHARPVQNEGAPRVLLWADTFNNHFTPETAEAAVLVLEDAGFQVVVPRGHLCCGRPLYDYGFLDRARRYLRRVVLSLEAEIKARTPMVGARAELRRRLPRRARQPAPRGRPRADAEPEHLPAQRAARPAPARRATSRRGSGAAPWSRGTATTRRSCAWTPSAPCSTGWRSPPRCSPPGAAGWRARSATRRESATRCPSRSASASSCPPCAARPRTR